MTILDSADDRKLADKIARMRDRGITVIAGLAANNHFANSTHYDLGVLSPGIDPAAPLVQSFLKKRISMIGELELAYELCRCPIIAITGSNGKTTTTGLTAAMLNVGGVKTVACGNISPAFSTVVGESEKLDVMTVEVSSFQLEAIRDFRPHIAVWMNLSPNHLDRYASVAEYRAAKLRIFENQTPEDFAVVNFCDELPSLTAKKITFSAYERGGDFDLREDVIFYHGRAVFEMAKAKLRGVHNAENIMAALGVGVAMGLDFERMRAPVCAFEAPPHRCEFVRNLDGVDYINDSKSTSLDAMEKALLAQDRPVILIAGGKNKGFGFDSLTGIVAKRVRAAILIGEMADKISDSWSGATPCQKAATVEEAVALARKTARSGEVVLFSPGTSSYDMFKNYVERGDRFRNATQALT